MWPNPAKHTTHDDSLARTLTLVGSILTAVAAGTNYVYSAYAPQLGARLQISHTQLNIIGLAGNVGVYSTGPLWGKIADRQGPKPLFLSAILLLFSGYLGIKAFYDRVFIIPGTSTNTMTPAFFVLVSFSYFTGAGGNAGLTASLNATAKSFPDKTRATVTGLVVSGFGLSAFLFSTIAHTIFPGNTSTFLLVLALGTTLPMALGFFIVKPILGESNSAEVVFSPSESNASLTRQSNDVDPTTLRMPLPSFLSTGRPVSQSWGYPIVRGHSMSPTSSFDLPAADFGISSPGNANDGLSSHHLHDLDNIDESSLHEELDEDFPSPPHAHKHEHTVDIHGKKLISSINFWLLFSIVSLLAGTGIMWINNVGSIAQALVAQGSPNDWDEERAAKIQAAQVSTISVMNCLGRIAIGISSDFGKHKYNVRRVMWLIPISIGFIASQMLALYTTRPENLFLPSATLGLVYGAMFSHTTVIALDWFGLPHFSMNWGFVGIAPVIGGNLFSIAFGRNLDEHASPDHPTSSNTVARAISDLADTLGRRAGGNAERLCFDGSSCYAASLRMTIVACIIAAALSAWATWRDRTLLEPLLLADARVMRRRDGPDANESDALLET